MWRSNQLSYRTVKKPRARPERLTMPSLFLLLKQQTGQVDKKPKGNFHKACRAGMREHPRCCFLPFTPCIPVAPDLQKGGVPAAPPVRLPCYDLAPITCFTLGRPSRSRTSGAPGFHGLTGSVYKARERIHRAMADARLLANPASRSRVADSDPN